MSKLPFIFYNGPCLISNFAKFLSSISGTNPQILMCRSHSISTHETYLLFQNMLGSSNGSLVAMTPLFNTDLQASAIFPFHRANTWGHRCFFMQPPPTTHAHPEQVNTLIYLNSTKTQPCYCLGVCEKTRYSLCYSWRFHQLPSSACAADWENTRTCSWQRPCLVQKFSSGTAPGFGSSLSAGPCQSPCTLAAEHTK